MRDAGPEMTVLSRQEVELLRETLIIHQADRDFRKFDLFKVKSWGKLSLIKDSSLSDRWLGLLIFRVNQKREVHPSGLEERYQDRN